MKDQLIGLFVRAFTIIARNRNLDAVGDQLALEQLNPRDHAFRHRDSIGSGALGDGEADGWGHCPLAATILRPAPGAGLVLGRGLFNPRDIGQQHRRAADRTDGERRQLRRIAQRLPHDD